MNNFSSVLRNCPVCESSNHQKVRFKKNVNVNKLNEFSYSSRKMPEFMNFKLVVCPTCDLLYACEVEPIVDLAVAYNNADYDSHDEANYAAKSYYDKVKSHIDLMPTLDTALEIGCGNGAFLRYLLDSGFKHVIGIEPSQSAANAAEDAIKKYIRVEMFDANNFENDSFNLIIICQTLEHLENPMQFILDSYKLLKKDGMLIIVSHDYRGLFNTILGKYSPIVDIEHLQIFSRKSIEFALKKADFKNITTDALHNVYPIKYWLKLSPLPRTFKNYLLQAKAFNKLANIPVKINVGNTVTIAYK